MHKISFKRMLMILLMYLIPLVNILVLVSNYSETNKILMGISSVLASTAAASACTIKVVKNEAEKITIAQAFALVFSMVSFINCLVYGVYQIVIINRWIGFALSILANGIAIYMFCISDKEIIDLIDKGSVSQEDRREADEMIKKADRLSGKHSNDMSIHLTKKGVKANE